MVSPAACTSALWFAWLAGWILAARSTATTVVRQPLADRLTHSVLMWGGAALLFFVPSRRSGILEHSILPARPWLAWIGVVLVVVGLGFSVWARVHLGRLWSGAVTLKTDHTLIRTGPYRWTRHPIYTGLLLALLGTTLVRGTLGALAGFLLLVLGVLLKIRQEEVLLMEHFGDEYRIYRRDVPKVIPRLRNHFSAD